MVAGYTGTVHFSTTDTGAAAVVPADYTFVPVDGGVHVFTSGAVLVSPGVQTITAVDTAVPMLSASASVSVVPASATHFEVVGPTSVMIKAVFHVTVTALDPFGNRVTAYSGTVHFSSSDSQAILPVDSRLTGGMGIFLVTLNTPGMQTVTAADAGNAGLTGSVVVHAVNPLPIDPFVQSINRTTPAGPVTNASSVSYTVTFSEAVTGVAASDFQLAMTGTATGTVSQVTPVNGSVYTVTVSGVLGNGTLGLNLVDNGSIHDLAGDPLTQQNAPSRLVTLRAQTFAVGQSAKFDNAWRFDR